MAIERRALAELVVFVADFCAELLGANIATVHVRTSMTQAFVQRFLGLGLVAALMDGCGECLRTLKNLGGQRRYQWSGRRGWSFWNQKFFNWIRIVEMDTIMCLEQGHKRPANKFAFIALHVLNTIFMHSQEPLELIWNSEINNRVFRLDNRVAITGKYGAVLLERFHLDL